MRELKFRIWCRNMKRWLCEDSQYLQMDGKKVHAAPWSTINFDLPNENYIIEQYTGLKDVEGKKIYEGDILQRPCTRSDYIFKYTCEWSDGESAFMLRNNWDGVMDIFLPDFIKNLKIVGNISETSELLK